MLNSISVRNFAGVPYLETSQLMQTHKGKLRLSTKKPTVIVGPNGSGKSAFLTAVAIRFLAYFSGQSTFGGDCVMSNESKAWWTNTSKWGHDYSYLQGFDCKTDNAPALYYRPSHVPGNEDSVVNAMMTGYFEQAKAYGRAVDKKSSGQAGQTLLARFVRALQGFDLPQAYGYNAWRFRKEPLNLCEVPGYKGSYDYQAEVLKALLVPSSDAIPLVLMDEPEQSLDARAEAELWAVIAAADCTKMQIVVATHSLYPLLHAKRFHLIESEPGFIQDVVALVKA